jgi:hypothetical protein
MASTRTHRVDDRVVVPIAVVAGVVAALGPAAPTGSRSADVVLVALSVGVVTWAGATARWWTLVVLSVVATSIANSLLLAVVGIAAVGSATWIGTRRQDLPVARAVVVAAGLNVAIRSEVVGFLGLSTLLTMAAAVMVLISGVRRRRGVVRRRAVIAVAVLGGAAVVATLGAGVALARAAGDLSDGEQLAREGIALLNDGEYASAAEQFEQASVVFAEAADVLDGAWSRPSAWLPLVAQQRWATASLSAAAASASGDLAAALQVVDPEQLRLVGGRFDLDAIRLMEQPFTAMQSSIAELRDAVDAVDSPWVLASFGDRLEELDIEVAENATRVDNAVTAVRLAPRMLGAEGVRRYFVAFTTPAEARGMGGFMGNWAILTANDGRLRLAEFGRTRDLNLGGEPPRYVTGPGDWLAQWGRFGFTNGPGGSTSATPWSNVTISPVFPSTSQVVQELLPQSGGGEVDGVFALDPQVLQSLLALTGPISVEGSDTQLSESNVVEFLLIDQYELADNDARVDLLEAVSRATIEQVLGGALPNPVVVAGELGPLLTQGRLVGSATEPEEQALFEAVGLATSLPSLDGGDGIAAVFNNAGPNKIDVYLERDLEYTVVVDERTGSVTSTLELTLANGARPEDLPDSVVGNATGDARGTNRTLLSLYSALPLRSASVDGEPIVMTDGEEAGWTVNSAFLGIPPGGSITVTVEYAGVLTLPDGYTLAVRPQPLVIPEQQTIRVSSSDGQTLIARTGIVEGPETMDVDDEVPTDE